MDQNNDGPEEGESEEELESAEEEEEEQVDPRTLLTKEQIENFKQIFNVIDVLGKEQIPSKSIGFVLRLLGLNPTKAQIKKHIQEIDPKNTGLIDFDSFLLPIARTIEDKPQTHEDIIAAFKIFDEEELDCVPVDTLYLYLTTTGEDMEDYEIEIFLKMAETKGTGKVYYKEFVEKMFGMTRKTNKGKKGKGKGKGKKKK